MQRILLLLALLFTCIGAEAKTHLIKELSFSIDLPAGWTIQEASKDEWGDVAIAAPDKKTGLAVLRTGPVKNPKLAVPFWAGPNIEKGSERSWSLNGMAAYSAKVYESNGEPNVGLIIICGKSNTWTFLTEASLMETSLNILSSLKEV